MANATNKLKSQLACRTYIHNPATATTAEVVAWVPIAEFFLAIAAFVSGTGVLTMRIMAALDSLGTTPTEVKAHSAPTAADAEDDQLVLEVSAEDIRGVLANATHVGVEMDMDHADDICAVTYIRSGLRFTQADMTADVIS